MRKTARAGAGPSESRRPGGDDLPYVFSGSLVVRGTAMAEVVATGIRSEIGKIGQSLATLETEPPRLQAQTRRVVRIFAIAGAAVSMLAVVLYGTLRGGWLDAVLAGIALGMSMLPEEFPVVLAVFMAMGAWRISQARVLTRRAAAIETLGSATVLCTDKTGTLTENRMTIAELRLGDDETFRPRETRGARCRRVSMPWSSAESSPARATRSTRWTRRSTRLGREQLAGTGHLHGAEWNLAHAYGLRPGLLAMSRVWQPTGDRRQFVVAAKGAPEAIADLCHLGPDRAGRAEARRWTPWPPKACACWASPALPSRRRMACLAA